MKLISEYNSIDWINDKEVNRKNFLLQKDIKINDNLNSIIADVTNYNSIHWLFTNISQSILLVFA